MLSGCGLLSLSMSKGIENSRPLLALPADPPRGYPSSSLVAHDQKSLHIQTQWSSVLLLKSPTNMMCSGWILRPSHNHNTVGAWIQPLIPASDWVLLHTVDRKRPTILGALSQVNILISLLRAFNLMGCAVGVRAKDADFNSPSDILKNEGRLHWPEKPV